MAVRFAINGFGRIGRCVMRAALSRREDIEIVAINDLDKPSALAHLFKYDSIHRTWAGRVTSSEKGLNIDGKEFRVIAERDPSALPWRSLGVDVVFECTGRFTERSASEKHLAAGAKKVLLDAFGIEKGLMTTVHSYTNDQRILDLVHEDLRRARAAAMSIIPTSTGAAKAIGDVLPPLKGKMHGVALRVPTPNVSIVDLTVVTSKNATTEEVNAAYKRAAEGPLKGILEYSEALTVSVDYNGNSHSAIFDATSTLVMGGNLVKVFSWYDNEWGFSNRMVDVAKYVASKGL